MRNLPTMTFIYQEKLELAAMERNNTEAKLIQAKLNRLKNPKHIMKTVGVIQILEIYAETSLEGQHTKHFPTQVWTNIKVAQSKLKKLMTDWEWSEEDMKFARMEAPSKIVARLRDEGRYEPKLRKTDVVKRQQEMRESGLLQEGQTIADLFDDEEQQVPLAGELIMEEETTADMIKQVEAELVGYSKDIYNEWMKRHIQTDLEAAASALLGAEVFADVNIDNEDAWDSDEDEDGADKADWSTKKKRHFKLLKNLIKQLPERQATRYDPVTIFPGLECWLGYIKNRLDVEDKPGEDIIYQDWFKLFVSHEESLESNVAFSKLFQNVQIRSSSEVKFAICTLAHSSIRDDN